MSKTVSSETFSDLFCQDTPFLDVRAPCEFSRGAFPNTTNLPLLSDSEREAVGTLYKRDGKSAAIALGHRLVNAEAKERLLVSWMDYINNSPNAVLLLRLRRPPIRGKKVDRTNHKHLMHALWIPMGGAAHPSPVGKKNLGLGCLRSRSTHRRSENSRTIRRPKRDFAVRRGPCC